MTSVMISNGASQTITESEWSLSVIIGISAACKQVFFTKKVKHISYGASYKALLAGIIIQPQVSHTFIYGRCRQHRVSVQHGLA